MIKPINLLQLLQSMNQSTKIYWQSKDNSFSSVCFGKVCYYTFDEIQKEFKKKNNWIEKKIRFYGAIPFLFDFTLKKKWKDFKKTHFIVPRYEFFREKKKYYLAINFRLKDNILSDFSELIASYQKKTDPFGMLQLKKKKYIPTKKKWQSNLIKVKKLFSETNLKKLVLARLVILKLNKKKDISALFTKMAKNIKDCYIFYWQCTENNAFISFSPEKLFKRKEKYIQSDAIAGTKPRGKSKSDDRELTETLKKNAKETEEHKFVEKEVFKKLQTLCDKVKKSHSRKVLKLNYIQHLYSSYEGILKKGIDDAKILRSLHPTPAVGGLPTDLAVHFLKKFENFQRGLYASPIGYMGKDHSEFAVGIRSALLNRNKIFIYSGAGITKESIPELEWEELDQKIKTFFDLFDGNPKK